MPTKNNVKNEEKIILPNEKIELEKLTKHLLRTVKEYENSSESEIKRKIKDIVIAFGNDK
jgi:hypothetical protein